MKGIVAASVAAGLMLLLLAGASLPASRAPAVESPVPLAFAQWGSLAHLRGHGTLLVENPDYSYSVEEVASVRGFLDRGGRVLVVGLTPPAASLVRALDVGLDPLPARVYDPDVDAEGRMTVTATGALGAAGSFRVDAPQIVLGGQAILSSGAFTWQDRDADAVPDITEPRGAWPVATLQAVGQGQLVVLGAVGLAKPEVLGPVLSRWMEPPLVLDGVHQVGPDPVGVAPFLAGQASLPAWGAWAMLLLAGGAIAGRARLQKRSHRTRGPRSRDWETLETVAELEA